MGWGGRVREQEQSLFSVLGVGWGLPSQGHIRSHPLGGLRLPEREQ